MRSLLASIALTALLAACAPGPYGPNQTVGTLVGAGAGALIGNQFGHGSGRVAATAGGAVIGGVIGNNLGYNADRTYYGTNYAYAPPSRAYYAPPPPRYYYYPPASYYGY
jgi:uncharacterized protein YcfJ